MSFADAYDPIRALTSAWRLMVRSPFPLFIAGAVLTLIGDGPNLGLISDDGKHDVAAAIFFLCSLGLCCGLVELFLASWLSIGLANATENVMVNGKAAFEDVFVSKGRFFDMVLLRVLCWLILIAAAIPFFVVFVLAAISADVADLDEGLVALGAILGWLVYFPFYVYLMLGISLSVQAVAIEGLKPTEALRRSWSIANGNRLRLLVYWLALCVFTLLGLCLCCVGIFGTGALAHVAANESYLELVRTPARVPSPPPAPAVSSEEPPILPS